MPDGRTVGRTKKGRQNEHGPRNHIYFAFTEESSKREQLQIIKRDRERECVSENSKGARQKSDFSFPVN